MVRMMAVGNFEQTSADYIGIAQTTMSKILPQVCEAILKHFDTFVHMPRNEQECMQKAAGFAALADFPRCIGAIDCTHVKIISPGGDIVGVFFFSRVVFICFILIAFI